MSAPQFPDDLGTVIADLRRRVEILERTPRLPTVSTVGDLGLSWAEVEPEESTTSTTSVDLTTVGPALTVTVGQTGRVLIQGGAYTTSTVNNQTVMIEVWVKYEGSPSYQFAVELASLSNGTTGSLGVNISGSVLMNLGDGTHQLKLMYRQTLGGATARFAARWLMAQPF